MPWSRYFSRFISILIVLVLVSGTLSAASRSRKRRLHRSSKHRVTVVKKAKSKASRPAITRARRSVIIRGGPWTEPTFANSSDGDRIDGEDLEVRRAAVDALGPYNGSVVVVDPYTGRILTMVNQKLALSAGFQPCSTVKIPVALAALNEGLINATTKVRMSGGGRMDLTQALARSNNLYFASLGNKLGFKKVAYYARLFGYGEKAGWNIEGESAGYFPSSPPRNGGVGMLASFGEEIEQTPLQLAALMAALANGGTLYYLQYPRSQEEVKALVPRVKRELAIRGLIPEILPGMLGAVEYGTARRAAQVAEPIAGKTGTCTNKRTHLGWFGAFNNTGGRKLAMVVLLTGGKPSIGPMAAAIAGDIYRRLGQTDYFAKEPALTPAFISTPICCTR